MVNFFLILKKKKKKRVGIARIELVTVKLAFAQAAQAIKIFKGRNVVFLSIFEIVKIRLQISEIEFLYLSSVYSQRVPSY